MSYAPTRSLGHAHACGCGVNGCVMCQTGYRPARMRTGQVECVPMNGLHGADGLGAVFTSTLNMGPLGSQAFSLDVPYEKLATDAVNYAAGQAKQHLPELLNQGTAYLKGQLPSLMDQALKQGGGYVTDTLWPEMQPKLRAEADRVLGIATERAAIIAGVLVLTIFGTAIITSQRRKG